MNRTGATRRATKNRLTRWCCHLPTGDPGVPSWPGAGQYGRYAPRPLKKLAGNDRAHPLKPIRSWREQQRAKSPEPLDPPDTDSHVPLFVLRAPGGELWTPHGQLWDNLADHNKDLGTVKPFEEEVAAALHHLDQESYSLLVFDKNPITMEELRARYDHTLRRLYDLDRNLLKPPSSPFVPLTYNLRLRNLLILHENRRKEY